MLTVFLSLLFISTAFGQWIPPYCPGPSIVSSSAQYTGVYTNSPVTQNYLVDGIALIPTGTGTGLITSFQVQLRVSITCTGATISCGIFGIPNLNIPIFDASTSCSSSGAGPTTPAAGYDSAAIGVFTCTTSAPVSCLTPQLMTGPIVLFMADYDNNMFYQAINFDWADTNTPFCVYCAPVTSPVDPPALAPVAAPINPPVNAPVGCKYPSFRYPVLWWNSSSPIPLATLTIRGENGGVTVLVNSGMYDIIRVETYIGPKAPSCDLSLTPFYRNDTVNKEKTFKQFISCGTNGLGPDCSNTNYLVSRVTLRKCIQRENVEICYDYPSLARDHNSKLCSNDGWSCVIPVDTRCKL